MSPMSDDSGHNDVGKFDLAELTDLGRTPIDRYGTVIVDTDPQGTLADPGWTRTSQVIPPSLRGAEGKTSVKIHLPLGSDDYLPAARGSVEEQITEATEDRSLKPSTGSPSQ